MKNQILSIGKVLDISELKSINGGSDSTTCPDGAKVGEWCLDPHGNLGTCMSNGRCSIGDSQGLD